MPFLRRAVTFCCLLLPAFGARQAAAADLFYDLRLSDLDFGGKQIPQPNGDNFRRFRPNQVGAWASRVILDGPGEVYMEPHSPFWQGNGAERSQIVLRAPDNVDVKGRLLVPTADAQGVESLAFSVARSAAKPDAKTNFYAVKLAYLNDLVDQRIPGSAWFRHQVIVTRQEMGRTRAEQLAAPADRFGRQQLDAISDAFDYVTGGRALSENLQLDRMLRVSAASKDNADSVPLAELKGISIAEIDWSKLNTGRVAKLDALSVVIPADQHAVFFPSFNAFVRVIDEGLAGSAPVLAMTEPRAEDARTLERYQRQLCLSLSTIGRLVGPKVVKSVALTGSDPFYRTGTDLAILFEAADPAKLETLVLAQIAQGATADAGAKPISGEAAGLKYRGLRSPDRSICVYVAQLPKGAKSLPAGVVVTNSPGQLERLARVAKGSEPALTSLEEFQFFRNRYPLGDAEETALVFLSDATIRRWCSPRWRIAASRRVRDLAVINELQAAHLADIVKRQTESTPLETDFTLSTGGKLQLTAAGVASTVLGTLGFQTPIAEIPLERVTPAEAEAYKRWRESYELNWRWAFDPIGLRISLLDQQTAADLTVMPLIAGSDYRQFLDATQGAKLQPAAADPHDALGQLTLAVNPKSRTVQQFAGFAQTVAPGIQIDPLSWFGGTISVYADDDPIWAQIAELKSDQVEQFLTGNWYRLPVAVQFEVANSLKLTGFLVALRKYIDQASANMLEWKSLEYRDQTYVKVTPAPRFRAGWNEAAIDHAPTPQALIFSLSQDVLKRALDRQLDGTPPRSSDDPKTNGQKAGANATGAAKSAAIELLGENLAVHFDAQLLQPLSAIFGEHYQATMQRLAWNSLPILNEWHRLYPDVDPVELHERLWHVRLVCPGDGKYVWNDTFQTMESTVYGHPGEPKEGPPAPSLVRQFRSGDFGLTFENQGLRARAVLKRASAVPEKSSP